MTAADEDLISVIVPTYNAARYVEATMASILSQTHRNIEVIVVDDGSTDDTPARIEAIANRDQRVRLIRQQNQGVAAARNAGISAAKADFIAPCDADDLWTPVKLEKQLAVFRTRGQRTGLVYCWYVVVDEHCRVLSWCQDANVSGPALEAICRSNFIGNGSTPLIRRNALIGAGGYDPSLRARGAEGCEDLKLYIRLAQDYEFALVSEVCMGYRHTYGNMSSNSARMLRSFNLVKEDIIASDPSLREPLNEGRLRLLDWLRSRAVTNRRLGEVLSMHSKLMQANPSFAMKSLYWTYIRPRLIRRYDTGRALADSTELDWGQTAQ